MCRAITLLFETTTKRFEISNDEKGLKENFLRNLMKKSLMKKVKKP